MLQKSSDQWGEGVYLREAWYSAAECGIQCCQSITVSLQCYSV